MSKQVLNPAATAQPRNRLKRPRLAAVPVNINTVTDSDATLTAQPSGKTLKIYVIAANDAGQATPSETVTITVP